MLVFGSTNTGKIDADGDGKIALKVLFLRVVEIATSNPFPVHLVAPQMEATRENSVIQTCD